MAEFLGFVAILLAIVVVGAVLIAFVRAVMK